MKRFGRARLAALLVSVLFVASGVAFVWLHVSTPSDGARLQPGQMAWQQNGVQVTVLRPQPGGLRTGDVVIAVAGRGMESWADGLFDPRAPHLQLHRGETVVYTVLRDGHRTEVPVKLGAYPLGAILRDGWGTIFLALAFELVAVFVFIRRPAERAAQVLLVGSSSLVAASTWSFGAQVSDITSGWGFWLFIATTLVAYGLFFVAFLHFALTFPRRHPITTRWPPLVPTLYIAPVVGYAAFFALTRMATASTLEWIDLWMPAEGVLALICIVCMIAGMVSQYRMSRDTATRQKIRWVVFAAMVSSGVTLLVWVIPVDVLGYQFISVNVLGLLGLPVPFAVAIAILRYQLFDIDVIIRRTLIYGTLTAILAAVYFAIVVVAQVLSQRATGQTRPPDWLIVVTTLLIAALFTPLRRRVQQVIDRRFYRSRYDAKRTVEAFGTTVRSEIDLAGLRDQLVTVVDATMQPAHISLWLRPPAGQGVRSAE